MTWADTAAKHLNHRAVLRSPTELECVDCSHKLLLPREPRTTASGPPPYRRPDPAQAAAPGVVAYRKAEALAALELARQKRTQDPQRQEQT